jgi:hypothetical protein
MRAARRKGKWLGGRPILGYDVDLAGGGLKINAEEAQRVRWIFQWMAEANSVADVLGEISQRGWATKRWISRSGRQHPGRAFQESDLVRLVENVTYVGKLRDGAQVYQGEHAAIVDVALWERANAAAGRWQKSARREPHNVERKAQVAGPPSVPRISRLLALALKMEEMIQEGAVKNYSELARRGQVSAARITQVMNLLHLAPDVQEQVLLCHTADHRLRESAVRKLSTVVLWSEQRNRWREVLAADGRKRTALRCCPQPATPL